MNASKTQRWAWAPKDTVSPRLGAPVSPFATSGGGPKQDLGAPLTFVRMGVTTAQAGEGADLGPGDHSQHPRTALTIFMGGVSTTP